MSKEKKEVTNEKTESKNNNKNREGRKQKIKWLTRELLEKITEIIIFQNYI